MNNMAYYDILKSAIINAGYNSTDIDQKISAIIEYANEKNLNILEIVNNGFDFTNINSEIIQLLNFYRPPTSYITKRVEQIPISKFITRSIIE